jgi:peptidoglycan/LPS O-acetylase OafA/YrhL
MPGGFVGVDIFFVISGYLISSIILADMAASRFSIMAFYERRIRRIFPALFAMLFLFSAFALVYFLPLELVGYSKSLFAATASWSNFYFWRHSGYFDSPKSNPLLHTWSLAVEEQFYIFFPAFLLLIHKLFPSKLRSAIITLSVLSLISSVAFVSLNRDTAFYMPFTRAWELLLGTILSLKMLPVVRSPWLRNIASAMGAAMIAYTVFSFNSSTLFPGFAALVPCLGTVLIIWAGESGGSLIGSLLSLRTVAFIGLISYSLYLYHWPVIILHKMGVLFPGGDLQHAFPAWISAAWCSRIIEVVISLILAVFSWRFIERPFRNGPLCLDSRPLLIAAGGVVLVFLTFSATVILATGFKGRFSPMSEQLASYLGHEREDRAMRAGSCFITTTNRFESFNTGLCLHRDEAAANYLLLGDSHSAMLWAALSSSFPSANLMQASASGCAPILHPSGTPDCKKMMTYIYGQYLLAHPVEGLLLEKSWGENDMKGLAETVVWAKKHGVKLIILGPITEYDAPLPRLEAYSVEWNQPQLVSQHRLNAPRHIDDQLQNLAKSWQVSYVSLYSAICKSDLCAEYADSERRVPLMFDDNHLTTAGATFVVQRLANQGKLWLGEDEPDKRAQVHKPSYSARFLADLTNTSGQRALVLR